MEKLGIGDPQRIGGYRLLARLGAGGMGQVYLARSDRGRTVAVKLVRRELAAREEFRARFRQEVRSAQRVGGFWTAPVLDADTEAEVPWVATGYVAGPSLQQVVSHDHGPLPERSVRILAAGLAHALTNIHAAGIVHRDLKPSNVMVTIEGPRVIDFGVARALESVTGDSRLTQAGAVIGSPGFMAPEQVRGGPVTPASDVFCLGAVLCYAATGAYPFGSADTGAHALMFRIAEDEPDLSRVPEGIADLVRACLRKDPAARPTLDQVLERTGADDTVSDGRSRDPWLPGTLVAQLGRHAVRLLEVEDPEAAHNTSATFFKPPATLPEPPPETAPEHAGPRGIPPQTPPPQTPQTPPPTTHPAYGHPRQHPSPTYGYPPQQNPYAAEPQVSQVPQDSPRRNGRTTTLLILTAVVVAIAAGGSVYAYLTGDDTPATGTTASNSPSQKAPTLLPSPSESASPSPGDSPSDGVVPAAYLGVWTTTIENATGTNKRQLTISQGEVGDAVLGLVAEGDTYRCEFTAALSKRPGGKGPLEIGPSKITTAAPRTACTPGAASEVTLLADGRLQRVNTGTGEKLTYTKQ
ncbi:Serine/threonine protein kinase [Streptomyces sp. yr375]|uniref:serine/threonine-protein kinase n=1 Tax=Streptomyces sp. yr375 TaxID=1761906 RepID=UPI0008C252C5|nr:serine/threonine-protein kinase [Streptomyces sp. yr375]SEQ70105.1 Serine/threonine protein kinase [Streptomyces sp. yr375]